jgi:hypothetical protein
MLLIPDSRLALLSPWKTASQTLQARLGPLAERPYPALPDFNASLRRVVHQHLTLADWDALAGNRSGFELAVFVRNPYDRVVSGFRQLLRDIQVLPRLRHPSPLVAGLIAEQSARVYAGLSSAGFDLNRWFDALPLHALHEAGHNVCLPLHPATYWTHRDGRLRADFIGRVEDFERDFERLRARYRLPETANAVANRSSDLPAKADVHGYLYTHLLTPRTIARINAVFAQDFALLGYEPLSPRPG